MLWNKRAILQQGYYYPDDEASISGSSASSSSTTGSLDFNERREVPLRFHGESVTTPLATKRMRTAADFLL